MTVAELQTVLADKPSHMLVLFNDGENGRRMVSSVSVEGDYYHAELEVLVIGAKP